MYLLHSRDWRISFEFFNKEILEPLLISRWSHVSLIFFFFFLYSQQYVHPSLWNFSNKLYSLRDDWGSYYVPNPYMAVSENASVPCRRNRILNVCRYLHAKVYVVGILLTWEREYRFFNIRNIHDIHLASIRVLPFGLTTTYTSRDTHRTFGKVTSLRRDRPTIYSIRRQKTVTEAINRMTEGYWGFKKRWNL